MTDKITFRVDKELYKDLDSVYRELVQMGLDLDQSKVIRYVLNKGIEKLRLEGKLK